MAFIDFAEAFASDEPVNITSPGDQSKTSAIDNILLTYGNVIVSIDETQPTNNFEYSIVKFMLVTKQTFTKEYCKYSNLASRYRKRHLDHYTDYNLCRCHCTVQRASIDYPGPNDVSCKQDLAILLVLISLVESFPVFFSSLFCQPPC